jgi:hypothetical protein
LHKGLEKEAVPPCLVLHLSHRDGAKPGEVYFEIMRANDTHSSVSFRNCSGDTSGIIRCVNCECIISVFELVRNELQWITLILHTTHIVDQREHARTV